MSVQAHTYTHTTHTEYLEECMARLITLSFLVIITFLTSTILPPPPPPPPPLSRLGIICPHPLLLLPFHPTCAILRGTPPSPGPHRPNKTVLAQISLDLFIARPPQHFSLNSLQLLILNVHFLGDVCDAAFSGIFLPPP